MIETDFFLTGVAEQYGRQPIALHPLRRNNPEGKRLYRVDFTEGPSWVMRTYRQNYIDNEVFHWLSRYSSLFEWLKTRAGTLVYVAQQGYLAPVVIPSQAGVLLGLYEEWYILMTTFIHGDAKETHPEKMCALGASLGHLHTLPLPEKVSSMNNIGVSWWPIACLHDGLSRLASSAQYIPQGWQEFYNDCSHTFQYFLQHPHLPQTLIHGDCWAENGIQIQEEQAILIDWECAGLGISVLDFGSLLLHCHFDQIDVFEHQSYPQYQPDPYRIVAVVNGYYRWRQLLSIEFDVLLEAIRFSIAWRGVWFFSLITNEGPNEWLQNILRGWHRWYTISEEIAHLSRIAIKQTR